MNINLQLLLPKKWAWFKLISFVTFFTNHYYNYCCISITWREALLESRKNRTFILHWKNFLVRLKTLNKRKWMNLIMSNVPKMRSGRDGERERERKRGIISWKLIYVCFKCKKLAFNNNDFNFICFTCLSCLWNKQLLLVTRNHFASLLTQHTPDELDTSILLILSCVTSSQRCLMVPL